MKFSENEALAAYLRKFYLKEVSQIEFVFVLCLWERSRQRFALPRRPWSHAACAAEFLP